ncbi:MAG TPA: hypothetical protein VFW83_02145 [Bryobacteraceae bacterium]|nr:hypothetical protein [Bryobacteraceae bacterium]
MEFLPTFLADVTGLLIFALIASAVMKLFQIATDIREMKTALQGIQRSGQGLASAALAARAPAASAAAISPEELVRAVNAQSYEEAVAEEPAALDPLVIPPAPRQ